jgi:hypothetical protein
LNSQRLKLRFAVWDAITGNNSAIWFVSAFKSDVYVGTRAMGHVTKISLHASGICRDAFTERHGVPPTLKDRVVQKWRRKPTPPAGTGEGSRAIWLAFPTDYLGGTQLIDGVTRIEAAPSGQATFVEMFFTNENERTVIEAFGTTYNLIADTYLANGEAFVVRSSIDRWDNKDLRMPASHHEHRDFYFTASLPPGVKRHLDIRMSRPPKDDDALSITELSGYAVPAGTPFQLIGDRFLLRHKSRYLQQRF